MPDRTRIDELPGSFGYGAGVLYGLPQPPRWTGEVTPDLQKVILPAARLDRVDETGPRGGRYPPQRLRQGLLRSPRRLVGRIRDGGLHHWRGMVNA